LQLKDVITIFGNEEAQRKVLFQKFWQTVKVFNDANKIQKEFDTWFEANKKSNPTQVNI